MHESTTSHLLLSFLQAFGDSHAVVAAYAATSCRLNTCLVLANRALSCLQVGRSLCSSAVQSCQIGLSPKVASCRGKDCRDPTQCRRKKLPVLRLGLINHPLAHLPFRQGADWVDQTVRHRFCNHNLDHRKPAVGAEWPARTLQCPVVHVTQQPICALSYPSDR